MIYIRDPLFEMRQGEKNGPGQKIAWGYFSPAF
jgi:hypothetical protein